MISLCTRLWIDVKTKNCYYNPATLYPYLYVQRRQKKEKFSFARSRTQSHVFRRIKLFVLPHDERRTPLSARSFAASSTWSSSRLGSKSKVRIYTLVPVAMKIVPPLYFLISTSLTNCLRSSRIFFV